MKSRVNVMINHMGQSVGVIVLSFLCFCASAQQAEPKTRHFAIYGGVGPNYYFNNLIKFKSEVNELNYSFVGRFMWEPEHLLTIGFETGYYRLYSIKFDGPNQTVIKNSAVPIQLVVGMKFLKSFYYNFSIGRSVLINDITTNADGEYDATVFSLADFTNTVGYRKKINDRFSLGSELKLYYSSKASDMNLALAFVAGYSF